MISHFAKAVLFSGLLAGSVYHLTQSEAYAAMAGVGLFALRMANMVPFATTAVPMLLCGFLLAQQVMIASPMGDAVRMLQNRFQVVSAALAAPLQR